MNTFLSSKRNTVVILFCFAVVALLVARFSQADEASNSSDAINADTIVWVDTRSWVENKIDSIEGDPRISYADIVDGVKQLGLQKNTPIRLYCAAGARAGKAVTILQAAGYSDVENAGGIDDVRTIRFHKPIPATN